MAPTSVEVSSPSKKHLVNARGFVLALLLLTLIGGAHVIAVCVRARAAFLSQPVQQEAAYLAGEAELSLRSYLLNGDTQRVAALESARQRLRELCAGHTELQEWSIWEASWYHDFAQPLIDGRRRVDQGYTTVSELQILYLQLDPVREESRYRTLIEESGMPVAAQTPQVQGISSREFSVHIFVALVIWITATLSALFGLRNISALGKLQASRKP
jgi:hypothetical protein